MTDSNSRRFETQGPEPSFEAVCRATNAKRNGNHYMGTCPCHEDGTQSLSVSRGAKVPVIVKCHAGCDTRDIHEALKAKGAPIFPEKPLPAQEPRKKKSRKRVAEYNYTDAQGKPVSRVLRFEPKNFVQNKYEAGQYHPHMRGARIVPFNLAAVAEAIARNLTTFIVEGEKDVDNLAKLGIVASCNAGGAGSFTKAHAEHFKGADVILVPDNDVPGRAHMHGVAELLKGIATRVRWLELPGLPDKGDVSNWIDQGGTAEAFWKLAEAAGPVPSSVPVKAESEEAAESTCQQKLDELNNDFCVVRASGKTRVASFEGGVLVYSSLNDWKAFFNKYRVDVMTADGNLVEECVGAWWIGHPERRQFARVVYDPSGETENALNLWTGFAAAAVKGSCEKYKQHLLANLCGGDTELFTYLWQWMAHAIQNPGRQGEVAVVLRGAEGTGKGIWARTFGGLFGPHFRHITQPGHLTGHFNAHLQQCSFLFVDEAFFAGDASKGGIIKALITEPTLMIEPKGIDTFSAPNCLHITMASNEDWVIQAGADARRYFVLDVSGERRQDLSYFQAIASEIKNGGREALLYELQRVDLTGFNIRQFPETAALAEQKMLSRKGVDRLVEIIAHDGILPCCDTHRPHIAITSGEARGEGFYAHAKKLEKSLARYGVSIQIATKLKKDWGCSPWHSGSIRGIEFPPLDELRTMFDRRHGKQDWPVEDDGEIVQWRLP